MNVFTDVGLWFERDANKFTACCDKSCGLCGRPGYPATTGQGQGAQLGKERSTHEQFWRNQHISDGKIILLSLKILNCVCIDAVMVNYFHRICKAH